MILCDRMRASSSSGLRVTALFLLNSFKRVNCVLIASLLLLATLNSSQAQSKIDFSRDVRPILARHCFACHGPDEAQREGGLRLDTEAGLSTSADSGKIPVQPGKPVQSELLDRILGQSGDRMPPEDHAAALEEKDVLTLRAWIEQGATWNRHFAFLPLDSSPTLSIETENQRRHEHPIDVRREFVLHRQRNAARSFDDFTSPPLGSHRIRKPSRRLLKTRTRQHGNDWSIVSLLRHFTVNVGRVTGWMSRGMAIQMEATRITPILTRFDIAIGPWMLGITTFLSTTLSAGRLLAILRNRFRPPSIIALPQRRPGFSHSGRRSWRKKTP